MRTALVLLGLLGCTKAGTSSEPITNPSPGAKLPPAAPSLAVQITAVTLGDDCGVAAVPPAPAAGADANARRRSDSDADWKQPCEQTSMQLAITSPAGAAPVEIAVKKVELYDENGKLLGDLTSRSPTVWDASAYKPWDQQVASGAQLSVSYLLAPPNWGAIGGRHSRMYTLKAVIRVGGADQTLQRDVQVMGITTLPPNVRT